MLVYDVITQSHIWAARKKVERGLKVDLTNRTDDHKPAELLVGENLRLLRARAGYSLRGLAEKSGLNVNTLSLIENGKSSPSVGTLQQLALALEIPLTAFFESEQSEHQVVYTPASKRPKIPFGSTLLEALGQDLQGANVQPFIVNLQPGMGSETRMVVHTGHEFVYNLEGLLQYQVEEELFLLNPGDSLLFKAHLPHRWQNNGAVPAKFLLVLVPAGENEAQDSQHFTVQLLKKELTMKIAVITDDGKTISQHFGRAPYYLVLTIEEGQVIERELREKMGHGQYINQPHVEDHGSLGHGMGAASHGKHVNMADTIADCKALICGGMGRGAYESMRSLDIKPLVTDLLDVETAVQAFIDGKLIDHTEFLH